MTRHGRAATVQDNMLFGRLVYGQAQAAQRIYRLLYEVVSELGLNQSIRLRDMPVDPKWKPVTDGDTMLVHVVMPKAEESAQATAEETAPAAAEPEVIKKGKADEDKEKEKK